MPQNPEAAFGAVRGREGFTMVEVIVVSVIVGVLVVMAVQVYNGFIQDARHNTAENLAASAAGFLIAAENIEPGYVNANFVDLAGNGEWKMPMPGGAETVFKVPAQAVISLDKGANSVKASVAGVESAEYGYDR